MKQLHTIQLQVLKRLLLSNGLKYSQLKPYPSMENNQLDFHVDQLIGAGYVEKNDRQYRLTSVGKEYANRMDTGEVLIGKQAKISVFICCTRPRKDQTEYLIYTRRKQPFYGCQGFMSGKMMYGETVKETAKRELTEETGLTGEPKIITLKHYRVFDNKSQELVEDKFMFFCWVDNPHGVLKFGEEGIYEWIAESNLKANVTNHFESYSALEEDIRAIKNFKGKMGFSEIDARSDKF